MIGKKQITLENEIAQKITVHICKFLRKSRSTQICFPSQGRSFEIHRYDGDMYGSIYDLINEVCIFYNIYDSLLTEDQLSTVNKLRNENYGVPNFSDEDCFHDLSFNFDEIEHQVISAVYLCLKKEKIETIGLENYFSDYGYNLPS